jgi:hypothetical protein
MLRAAVLLATLAGGCSAILAASGDPDLSCVRRGAMRGTIESEVGNPSDVEETDEGTLVVYKLRLGDPRDSDRAARNAARPFAVANEMTGGVKGDFTLFFMLPLAAAAAIVTEGVQTISEIGRHARAKRYRLEVLYDEAGRVVRHDLVPAGKAR